MWDHLVMRGTPLALSATQCQEARVLLCWTLERLALESEIAPATVRRFETSERSPRGATLHRIKATLEAAGVEFIPENGGGAGVRLKNA